MPKLAPLRISTWGQEVELVEPAVFGRKNAVGSGGTEMAWEMFAKKRPKSLRGTSVFGDMLWYTCRGTMFRCSGNGRFSGGKNAVGSAGTTMAWKISAKKRSKIAQRHFRFWREPVFEVVEGLCADGGRPGDSAVVVALGGTDRRAGICAARRFRLTTGRGKAASFRRRRHDER